MRSLITGYSGFAGQTLNRHLLECGDDVVGWSRSAGGPDITDRQAVFDAIAAAQVNVIYHLAAQPHVPTAWSDPVTTLRVNVEGTQNVLDAAKAANSPRIVVVTSAEVYGTVRPDQLPVVEDTPLRPTNPYAASKAAADALSLAAHLGNGLDVIRMRPFNHFGPGQDPSFVSAALARRIAVAVRDGSGVIEVGNLDARRDFSDVRDVVRAYRLAAITGVPGEVYNVSSGIARSIREIADALVQRSGESISFEASPQLQRRTDTPLIYGSANHLMEQTGWEPTFSFEQSIDDIYADAVASLVAEASADA